VEPTIYLIAGCNGAGKTTFAMEFLPKEVKCLRFLNADEIARGLSPLQPSAAAVRAGRILLEEFARAVANQESFGLETTLSGRTYSRLFQAAKDKGYAIQLNYLFLDDSSQAIERVRKRVLKGGHDIPELEIRRRFDRSHRNLVEIYLPLADEWTIWRNVEAAPKMLATSRIHDIDFARKLFDEKRDTT